MSVFHLKEGKQGSFSHKPNSKLNKYKMFKIKLNLMTFCNEIDFGKQYYFISYNAKNFTFLLFYFCENYCYFVSTF